MSQAIDDYVTSWESESSRLAPMLVQLTVASEDADARTKALASMHGYTGLSVVDRQATPQCVVNTLSFDTTRAQPNVKYVTNSAAREGSRTVAAYDAHVGSFHERCVRSPPPASVNRSRSRLSAHALGPPRRRPLIQIH